jgi:alkanesulfonate monooxygenase SsuD/methylene tetrahydromethanopterin reductase-like flavin-dependent oxidoreductase (luciferase family)
MPGHVRYEGRSFSVDGWMAPALVRPGGLELWVAGVSRATLRRAALTGVWHPVALPPHELRQMAAELRARRADSRVVLRVGVYFERGPGTRGDERGRHALAGPSEWVAERLREYVDAGANGFVVNLDHQEAGLPDRIARFAEEVAPLIEG